MNLAVLLYQHLTDKPAGIPDVWPALTKELGESTELPGQDWILMTSMEFISYIDAHQATYDIWYETTQYKEQLRIATEKQKERTAWGQWYMDMCIARWRLKGYSEADIIGFISVGRNVYNSLSIGALDLAIQDMYQVPVEYPSITIEMLQPFIDEVQARIDSE